MRQEVVWVLHALYFQQTSFTTLTAELSSPVSVKGTVIVPLSLLFIHSYFSFLRLDLFLSFTFLFIKHKNKTSSFSSRRKEGGEKGRKEKTKENSTQNTRVDAGFMGSEAHCLLSEKECTSISLLQSLFSHMAMWTHSRVLPVPWKGPCPWRTLKLKGHHLCLNQPVWIPLFIFWIGMLSINFISCL